MVFSTAGSGSGIVYLSKVKNASRRQLSESRFQEVPLMLNCKGVFVNTVFCTCGVVCRN